MAVWSGIARSRGAPPLLGREVRSHGAASSSVQPLRFRHAPLFYAAVAFALGILLRGWWRPAAMLVAACALLVPCGLIAAWRAPRCTLPALACVWIVLGWACATLQPPLQPSSAVLAYADGLRRDVVGTVVEINPVHRATTTGEDPLHWDEARLDAEDEASAPTAQSIDLKLSSIEDVTPDLSTMRPMEGGLRLNVRAANGQPMPTLGCGQIVHLTGRLRPPPHYRDPGVWQMPEYLAADGISATGSATSLQIVGHGKAPLACRWQAARQWSAARLQHFAQWQRHLHLPRLLRWTPTDAGLLNAMLFGDRTSLQRSLRVQFERTGSFHLFVVAGMHVGFVAAGTLWLLTRLRLRRYLAVVLSFAVTVAYALLTGFGDPVQRALWMTGAYLLAQLLARERSVLNALGLASLFLLVARPQTLFDSSFQMTALVVLAIGGVAMPLLQRTVQPYLHACRHLDQKRIDLRTPPRIAQFRVNLRFAGELLGAVAGSWTQRLPAAAMWLLLATVELAVLSLVAEMIMALPMAIYFHRATPLALPANLLVVPALPVLLACAVATFVTSLISPWLALVPSLLTAGLLRWTALVIDGFGHLHAADLRIGNPPRWVAILSIVLLCAVLASVRSRSRGVAWAGMAGVLLLLLLAIAPYPARLHPGTLEVTAIDVGQGDSLLLAGPNGATMLIDAGGQVGSEETARTTAFDTGESVVSPYLWSRGLRRLDVLVLTHAHLDHLGGMAAVLQNFRPRELWLSVDADSPTLRELLTQASALNIDVRHLHDGDHPAWAGGTMEVLNPAPNRGNNKEAENDDSLVLRTHYGAASVLLEGDAEHPSEDRMQAEHLLQPVTLLKIGHHGSLTSTSQAFLAAVQPRAAVISCGRGNRFGHPREPILERLQTSHVQTARTDTMGATQYLLHPDGNFDVHFPGAGITEQPW